VFWALKCFCAKAAFKNTKNKNRKNASQCTRLFAELGGRGVARSKIFLESGVGECGGRAAPNDKTS
jgi:hypothetical protein